MNICVHRLGLNSICCSSENWTLTINNVRNVGFLSSASQLFLYFNKDPWLLFVWQCKFVVLSYSVQRVLIYSVKLEVRFIILVDNIRQYIYSDEGMLVAISVKIIINIIDAIPRGKNIFRNLTIVSRLQNKEKIVMHWFKK